MKVKPIKFFRSNKPINHEPVPKPSARKRFELVKKGNKLDKFM